MVCRFAHVYMQSGGPNRERLYRAGYSPPRADQMGGRIGRGLNGNPVQSGGLNRERLYRAGYSPPRADQMGGRTGRGLNGNPMQEVNFIHHFIDLIEPFFFYFAMFSILI